MNDIESIAITKGATQAADLIGRATGDGESFGLMLQKMKRLSVLTEVEPTQEEEKLFKKLLKGRIIFKESYGLMIRVDTNISTNINLRNGYFGLGQGQLKPSFLYLARQYEGW